DRRQILSGHCRNAAMRWSLARETARLDPDDGARVSHAPGHREELRHISAQAMDEKDRRQAIARFQANQRDVTAGAMCPQSLAKRAEPRRLIDQSKGKLKVQSPL